MEAQRRRAAHPMRSHIDTPFSPSIRKMQQPEKALERSNF
jgi:hypothetical protein